MKMIESFISSRTPFLASGFQTFPVFIYRLIRCCLATFANKRYIITGTNKISTSNPLSSICSWTLWVECGSDNSDDCRRECLEVWLSATLVVALLILFKLINIIFISCKVGRPCHCSVARYAQIANDSLNCGFPNQVCADLSCDLPWE